MSERGKLSQFARKHALLAYRITLLALLIWNAIEIRGASESASDARYAASSGEEAANSAMQSCQEAEDAADRMRRR